MSDSTECILAEHPLGSREVLRIGVHRYRGAMYLSLHKWFYGADRQLQPGKRFVVHVQNIPRLLSSLEQAELMAIEDGELDQEAYDVVGRPIPAEILAR